MGIFRAIAFAIILLIFIYVSHQLTRFADLGLTYQILIISFIGTLFALVVGSLVFLFKSRNIDSPPWKDKLLNTAMTSLAYINFLIALVILRDLIAFAQQSFNLKILDEMYNTPATIALLSMPLVLMVLGNIVVQLGPQIKETPLRFENLPQELEGLRIIHISDLHIGPSLPSIFLRKLVTRVLASQPDIIVFTGDILDGFIERHDADLKFLKHLKANHGIFYVPGNHEYYWGIQKGLQAFREIGFNVLINESHFIESHKLQISGIPDPAANFFKEHGPNFEIIKQQSSSEHFKILLSHQPSLARKSAEIDFDLQLSGHTHGGQFFPWNWLIVFFERYAKGLYRIGKMQLYVNQGTGYWGPQFRLGTYCELTQISLHRK